ncbi:peptidoglycan-binding protein LysM [uncultured Paenalcaligenes sp.]|uniref:peptidoglycan-binding protein LysM n=1 Tax=uncultured Paenalcaligenes sp. TaxID=1588925 RepID=UPI002634FB44|nr:peptidoglycan-binding protein LysM [uncultured Paenalcaligenes sp.]
MSVFSFLKNVGAKIMGSSDTTAATSDELKKELAKHNLDAEGIEVSVEGDKVTVTGPAASTEQAEKIILALGNTMGVSAVENKLDVAQPATEARMYTVKSGDTLWKIAEEMYGKSNGAKYNVIFEANTPMLSHPDKIYPGQVLRIPELG